MKYLIFSDLHSFNEANLNIIDTYFDILVFLGDIRSSFLIKILQNFPTKPSVGILGNHDSKDLFKVVNSLVKNYCKLGMDLPEIEDINSKIFDFEVMTHTGFEGAPGDYDSELTMTQATADETTILSADILFSHETGYHYLESQYTTHEGFKVISKYVEQEKPKYHIFGHHHKNIQFLVGDTKCFCVYGCSVFDSETGTMINMFDE